MCVPVQRTRLYGIYRKCCCCTDQWHVLWQLIQTLEINSPFFFVFCFSKYSFVCVLAFLFFSNSSAHWQPYARIQYKIGKCAHNASQWMKPSKTKKKKRAFKMKFKRSQTIINSCVDFYTCSKRSFFFFNFDHTLKHFHHFASAFSFSIWKLNSKDTNQRPLHSIKKWTIEKRGHSAFWHPNECRHSVLCTR